MCHIVFSQMILIGSCDAVCDVRFFKWSNFHISLEALSESGLAESREWASPNGQGLNVCGSIVAVVIVALCHASLHA